MSLARRSPLAGLALALLALAAPVAHAADLLAPPPAPDSGEPASEMLDWGAGWYLRGDLSYSDSKVGSLSLNNLGLSNPRATESWSGGFGVGYKFFDYFRADMTVDYRTRVGLESRGTPFGCLQGTCELATNARFRNTVGLVNAYVDLGQYWRITPYVGAGVGVTRNQIGTTFETITRPGGGIVSSGVGVNGDSKMQFAWALMAGAAIAIDNNASLDIGYRYLNLGHASTATYTMPVGNTGAVAYARGEAKKLEAHEFRIGLRYKID